MTNLSYFLKNIETDGYLESLCVKDKIEVTQYLSDIKSCRPYNGDEDIDWHDCGKSYYVHDHILYHLNDPEDRKQYLHDLREDINEWEKRIPNHYVINRVKEMFLKELSLLDQKP